MQRFVLVSGLLALTTCFRADAQTMNLKAEVPFDFQLGDARLPAGTYQITHNGPVLTMRAQDGGKGASYLTIGGSRVRGTGEGVLVFNKYGGDYFLTKVVPRDEGDTRVLPKSRREKELMARSATVEVATATLRGK